MTSGDTAVPRAMPCLSSVHGSCGVSHTKVDKLYGSTSHPFVKTAYRCRGPMTMELSRCESPVPSLRSNSCNTVPYPLLICALFLCSFFFLCVWTGIGERQRAMATWMQPTFGFMSKKPSQQVPISIINRVSQHCCIGLFTNACAMSYVASAFHDPQCDDVAVRKTPVIMREDDTNKFLLRQGV